MSDTEKAREKLAEEERNFQGDSYGMVVYKNLAKTLKQFCSEQWFAQAILKTDKTLSDCCKAILSDVKQGISDVETYKRAVEFYVPGSTVTCKLSVCRSWDETQEPADSGVLSLLDLL
jgi:hypothetical protein